jgi:hypothetical protein
MATNQDLLCANVKKVIWKNLISKGLSNFYYTIKIIFVDIYLPPSRFFLISPDDFTELIISSAVK